MDAYVDTLQDNPLKSNSIVQPPISNRVPKHIQKQVRKKRPWLIPNRKPSKDEADSILFKTAKSLAQHLEETE